MPEIPRCDTDNVIEFMIEMAQVMKSGLTCYFDNLFPSGSKKHHSVLRSAFVDIGNNRLTRILFEDSA